MHTMNTPVIIQNNRTSLKYDGTVDISDLSDDDMYLSSDNELDHEIRAKLITSTKFHHVTVVHTVVVTTTVTAFTTSTELVAEHMTTPKIPDEIINTSDILIHNPSFNTWFRTGEEMHMENSKIYPTETKFDDTSNATTSSEILFSILPIKGTTVVIPNTNSDHKLTNDTKNKLELLISIDAAKLYQHPNHYITNFTMPNSSLNRSSNSIYDTFTGVVLPAKQFKFKSLSSYISLSSFCFVLGILIFFL